MRVFSIEEDGSLEPAEYAKGPFGGLQGGAIAAMLCSQLEKLAEERGLGPAVSASTTFLRATPFTRLSSTPRILREGGRSSTLTSELQAESKLCAITILSTLKHNDLAGIESSGASRCELDPTELPARQSRRSPSGGPWLMDIFEVRVDRARNLHWFGVNKETAASLSPLSLALLAADWAHGINRPHQTGYADPNLNLNLNCLRPPTGRWIGVQAQTDWVDGGIGVGSGSLFDTRGRFGTVSMSVAVAAMPGSEG